jgi:hypothetical protein
MFIAGAVVPPVAPFGQAEMMLNGDIERQFRLSERRLRKGFVVTIKIALIPE